MGKIRIGTRESQLAIWQATEVKNMLQKAGTEPELVYITSEGDIDLVTPLYDIGVQGIFTRSLDLALLNNRIDLAVHSMKDVPVQLAKGIKQAAVLKRGSYKDILVPHPDLDDVEGIFGRGLSGMGGTTITEAIAKTRPGTRRKMGTRHKSSDINKGDEAEVVIATSSIRRVAQWLRRFPHHKIENLRGNVNTRLKKLKESNWQGAIFAAAGLERIGLRPKKSIDLDWMLPAPAQGAIVVVCRENDERSFDCCRTLNDEETALCTKIERDFLKTLSGGCSTPIAALAEIEEGDLYFRGNILTPDGSKKVEIEKILPMEKSMNIGKTAAEELLADGGEEIITMIRHAKD